MRSSYMVILCFFFSSRRRHTRFDCYWSSDVCSSDLVLLRVQGDRDPDAVDALRGPRASSRHRAPRRRHGVSDARLLSVLIPAVGGQGGGVLLEWIVEAALADGLQVHGTSIPGVAQRTGSTTYYV